MVCLNIFVKIIIILYAKIKRIILVQPVRVHSGRGRKRGSSSKPRGMTGKRGRRSHNSIDTVSRLDSVTPARLIQPAERPDANMALKFTYGVNAWRQWVSIVFS